MRSFRMGRLRIRGLLTGLLQSQCSASAMCRVVVPTVVWSVIYSMQFDPAAASASPVEPGADSHRVEDAMRHDAGLAAVFFGDKTTGWTVGDRGVIWHTRDGGVSWVPQTSGVWCRLNSVFFINSRHGWAVGGEHLPYADATRGVVLRTDDGGATWTSVPGLVLPLLTGVKFFDAKVGVAFGFGSATQPSGVFVTRDGGNAWQPLPTDAAGQWLAGDFLDADAGAVAGPKGGIATLARQRVVHSPLASPSLRSFHAMRLAAPTGGWVVGDGGLVMTTSDLGRSWQTPPADLPDSVSQEFDFHALAVQGPNVWVAGSPGTRVFHSADGGANWQAFATGQFAPVRAMAFSDTQHGCAVGELGLILVTRDGGRTWQVQRAGGRRAALLAIFAKATDVPLELIAQHSAAESYIIAVNLLHGPAEDFAAGALAESIRAREALILAGASAAETAWRFPLPADDLALATPEMLNALNRANDGQGLKQFESHLARQLRMWRPDVVVTHHAPRDNAEPAAALLEQLVLRSVAAAADPGSSSELVSDCGLPPWQVKRVFGVLPVGVRGDTAVDANRVSAWLGETPGDWSAPARRLLWMAHTPSPNAIELKLLMSNSAEARGQNGLFAGVPLAHGSDARRPAPAPPAEDLDDARQMAARRRHLRELLSRTEGNAVWAGQVALLTEGLNARSGGELLFQLAEGYRAAGHLDLAADTYYLLARRFPEHPLVDRSLMWLVQFYASSEMGHRVAADRPKNVRHVLHEELHADKKRWGEGETERGGDFAASSSPPLPLSLSPTLANNAERATTIDLSRDDRLRRAIQLAEYLKTARPILYSEPSLRFAEVCAQRSLGYTNEAKRYFLSLGQLPESNPWRRCAATEQWLASPGETPPAKALATCRRAAARPHLDGRLDEPLWEAADVLRLRGDANDASESARGQAQLAYDDEYLYIAISCPQVGGGDYRLDHRPRPRDADLLQHDRVAIQIDIDRDYTSAFELTVDHRGWCHDACWGDANWNPTWFIAAALDEASWTIEAAIPLIELSHQPPATKHVWAVAARRTIPRVGYESWAADPTADADSPDRFGLVIFE